MGELVGYNKYNSNINVAEGLRDRGQAGRGGLLLGLQGAAYRRLPNLRAEEGEDEQPLRQGARKCSQLGPHPGLPQLSLHRWLQALIHRGQFALVRSPRCSIVMEFLDDGDLYQKIVAHQKASTEF
jgi:hypothetical protein